jgi:Zn-dependent peptidase ImmA (M78 family)
MQMARKSSVPYLSQEYIERKALGVLDWVRPTIGTRPSLTPVAEIVEKLVKEHGVQFQADCDLGVSERGLKVLGMCQFRPRIIYLDRSLDPNGPQFRFTLAHELGHLVLHRNLWLNPSELDMPMNQVRDDRSHVYIGSRRAIRTARDRLEFQANAFAASLLMPRNTLTQAVSDIQGKLGIRRSGRIFVDSQPTNFIDYLKVTNELVEIYRVSRTALVIRLKNLNLLEDQRVELPMRIGRLLRVA